MQRAYLWVRLAAHELLSFCSHLGPEPLLRDVNAREHPVLVVGVLRRLRISKIGNENLFLDGVAFSLYFFSIHQ